MARMAPKNVECIPHDAELPPHDFHFPLLSLPLFFSIDDETIPAKRSYLAADSRARRAMGRSGAGGEANCGWASCGAAARTHQRNMFRSVGIGRYVKAFDALENVAFFSFRRARRTTSRPR